MRLVVPFCGHLCLGGVAYPEHKLEPSMAQLMPQELCPYCRGLETAQVGEEPTNNRLLFETVYQLIQFVVVFAVLCYFISILLVGFQGLSRR